MYLKHINTPTAINTTIRITSDRKTVVSASTVDNDCQIWATGAAKLNPGDLYIEEIGVNIALGRALIKLGRKLEKAASNRSQTYEDAIRSSNAQKRDRRDLERYRKARSEARAARRAEKTKNAPQDKPKLNKLLSEESNVFSRSAAEKVKS